MNASTFANDLMGAAKNGTSEVDIVNKINAFQGGSYQQSTTNQSEVVEIRMPRSAAVKGSETYFIKNKATTKEQELYQEMGKFKLSINDIREIEIDKVEANDVLNYRYYSTIRFDLDNMDKLYDLPKKLEVIILVHYFIHERGSENENLEVVIKTVRIYDGKLQETEFKNYVEKIINAVNLAIEEKIKKNDKFKEHYIIKKEDL